MEVAGKTFVWDESTDTYVVSDLSGAPSNGVRFLLYAVDPVTLPPGRAGRGDRLRRRDRPEQLGAASNVRIKVVEANVTYLDYQVVASAHGRRAAS